MTETIRVLLLEDDPADVRLVQLMLRRLGPDLFQVESAGRLSDAVECLRRAMYDVVLADLSLPDSHGLDTLSGLIEAAPDIPVVVLTGNDDDALALDALKFGAQDYLVKGRGDGFVLSRMIRYAIERKIGERALRAERDRAEQAMRSKSIFLATVGHEIRTPLNGILGMARLLLDTALDARQRTFSETILSSGELLLGMVNDILDFSRLEADGLTLECVSFDVQDMVESLRLIMAPRAEEKGLMLGCRFAPGLPTHLRGDPLRLRQILLNLVGNAIKFTEKGGVTITVEPLNTPDAEGRLWLEWSVQDTGIGIAPGAQGDVFAEFTQADPSISRRFGGTGLGLTICKRLITLMGGEISYDSEPDHGSRFWFRVPLELGEKAAEPPTRPPRPAVHQPSRMILLVDDNPVNREVAAGLLERRGHQTVSAEDGYQAIEAARRQNFDLILLDVHMPGIDGIETARAIRALPGTARTVPIWLLTANPFGVERPRWREAGIDGCFAKPFRVEEVLRLFDDHAVTDVGQPPPAPDLPILSLTDLLADLHDLGRERMNGLVDLYKSSSGEDVAEAKRQCLSADFVQLANVVHRMASASASLHLLALNEKCRKVENLARQKDPSCLAAFLDIPPLWEQSVQTLTEVVE